MSWEMRAQRPSSYLQVTGLTLMAASVNRVWVPKRRQLTNTLCTRSWTRQQEFWGIMHLPIVGYPVTALECTEKVPWTLSRTGPYTAFKRTALRELDTRSGSSTHLDTWIWGEPGLHSPFLSPSTSLSLCFSIYRWMGLRWWLRSLSDALWASGTQEKAAAGPRKAGARCPHLDQDRVHSQPPQHWIADSENHHCLCRVTTPCHLSGLWNCKYPEGRICMWLTSASLVILAEW